MAVRVVPVFSQAAKRLVTYRRAHDGWACPHIVSDSNRISERLSEAHSETGNGEASRLSHTPTRGWLVSQLALETFSKAMMRHQ